MALYKVREAKRNQIETLKRIENQSETGLKFNSNSASKSTTKNDSKFKPLSYEELMRKAEINSKNTLSLADLNMSKDNVSRKINPITPEPIIKRSRSPQNVKTTKIKKINMQPKTETGDLVILNQKKRDLRSIEQIQYELKQKGKMKMELKDRDPEKYYAQNYSSIISSIFRYDRNKFTDIPENDTSAMESDYRTILAEEAHSSRQGMEEDLREEMEEINRKKRKAELMKTEKSKSRRKE